MPSITPAQILAVAGWVAAQAVAFGLLDPAREQLAVSIGATVLAAVLKGADSYLRGQRAKAHAVGRLQLPPAAPESPPA